MTKTPEGAGLPSLQTIQGLAGRMYEGVLLYDGASRLLYANTSAHKLCRECYPRDLSSGPRRAESIFLGGGKHPGCGRCMRGRP